MPKVIIGANFKDINFECQRCGACCRHRRPADFDDLVPMERLREFWEKSNLIYLTEIDIRDISRRTGRSIEEFVDTLYKYDGCPVKVEDFGTKVILDLPVMKSKHDATCVFFNNGCIIYPVRPRACRLFPFRAEEETTPEGDILLSISYNPSCPGLGKGGRMDKKRLEKLVSDQFLQRSRDISPTIQRMAEEGRIDRGAKVYRTLPGRRDKQA